MSQEVDHSSENNLKRELNLLDATLLVAGGMIGSGIFIVSADIVRNVGSAGWLILVWIIGGVMTLIAAISYGELSAMYPRAGGQYVYLREAYNPLVAFLYGWSLFAVIQTGTIAAVGVSFAKFLAYLLPWAIEDIYVFRLGGFAVSVAQLVGISVIIFLTYVNRNGVKGGKIVQTVFTSTKILSIAGLIVFGFVFFREEVWTANWLDGWRLYRTDTSGNIFSYEYIPALGGAIASALVGAIMSYEAWNNVTFVAGEINNPRRNIGLSLLLGTGLVTLIYVLLNLMFTAVLPVEDIASAAKDRVGIVASEAIFGPSGTIIIAVLILIATFGCNNGLILAGARVYYSMARDGSFFSSASKLNRHAVPETALWLQALVASILCLSGKYGDLLDMITFVAVMFYVLTIAGIYILRIKQPDHPRPYRAPGYPFLPAVYILLGLAFCLLLIIYKPGFTWPGLIIALTGIPVYFVVNKKRRKAESGR